jgi:hypothetical protein
MSIGVKRLSVLTFYRGESEMTSPADARLAVARGVKKKAVLGIHGMTEPAPLALRERLAKGYGSL